MSRKYEDQADRLCSAIKELVNNEYSFDNFKYYVSCHGEEWYKKFCGSLDGLISELDDFSKIRG